MAVQRCQSNKAKRMQFSAPLGSPVGLHLLSVPMPKAGTRDDTRLRIRTALKAHQVESLHWKINAWKAGLPGVLNADEQGLGKTLQTIAFLRWLKDHMARTDAEHR